MKGAFAVLALLVLAAPAAQAAQWVSPDAGAVLGGFERVRVRAPPNEVPLLGVDAPPGDKSGGQPLQAMACDGGDCTWEAFLDTRPLAAGSHVLHIAGVSAPPEPRPVNVDNARSVERVHVYKDPFNPWPAEVQPGTAQRRLAWVANLGNEERNVTLRAEAAGWDGVRMVEVVSGRVHGDAATWTLAPGGRMHVQLLGNATAEDGRIRLWASTPSASASLEEPFGDGVRRQGSPLPIGLHLAAPALAAALARAGTRRRST